MKILEEEKQKLEGIQTLSEEEEDIMKEFAFSEKNPFIENNQEEFEKHLLQILNQIEVFENQKAEGEEEENNKSSQQNSEDNIDFSDINSIFENLKDKAVDHDKFNCLLAIIQNLWLIPCNESGNKLWIDISKALNGINGIEGINLINSLYILLQDAHILKKSIKSVKNLSKYSVDSDDYESKISKVF